MAYEPIHMTWDYWDGPRTGIADCEGRPHYFSCLFDPQQEEYRDLFAVTPIDAETWDWAQQHWAIWQRWEAEVNAGRLTPESHPKYGHFDPRYTELEALIDAGIDRLRGQTARRRGALRRRAVEGELFPGQWNRYEIEWSAPLADDGPDEGAK
ncbi:hypothetical protein [Lysobacter enzymogenes]|uniref:hypothetical protein n=1 Tax=Lysobacter enzymogenes TaxID=69 RepID=UPI001AF1888F|nr:hypothetical protein [Lysobacter enzymogenes]QQP99990.1 hypothetical protein JHW41_18035 [Lysobacter enzymogenes]